MSIFASLTTDTVPVPADIAGAGASHTVTIQKLTGRALERAQAEHLKGLIAGRSGRGWARSFSAALVKGPGSDAEAEALLADPLKGYDRTAIVAGGLTGWTYSETVTPAQIDDLTDEFLDWAATAIMRLTKPGLFQTVDEAEAARKNG